MMRRRRTGVAVAAMVLFASLHVRSQAPTSPAARTTTESVGDVVKASHAHPVHIVYVHGINQVGAGDSALLRKGICKYLGECTVTSLGRVYADGGPFILNHAPPNLVYMEEPIWNSSEDWNASAPFIDRYQLTGHGYVPIIVDEFNWWPLAYPLKCKWLIPHDADLAGPSKEQIETCSVPKGNQPDPDHAGRYLAYRWIDPAEAAKLEHKPRRAALLNRSLKSGLMDWGFGDAVMALGPMQEVLTSGIRQLLRKSLELAGVDLNKANPEDAGPEYFLIAHSLGSFLSLVAIDSDWLGPQSPELAEFAISPEEKLAVDYFSAHTTGLYFLANQVGLLELAEVSSPAGLPDHRSAGAPSNTATPTSLRHWQSERETFRLHHAEAPSPQIIAWSDPDDLLSWDVPAIEGVHVENIHLRNSGFKMAPFIAFPTSAHANYAKNSKVLSRILKPTPHP